MYAMTRILAALAATLTTAVLVLAACSSQPGVRDDARQHALQAQVDDLDRELTQLHNAAGPDQAAIMHDYWDMLQRQLRYVHNLPGVESRGCNDWMVTDVRVTGQSPFWVNKPCPTLHDEGPASGWAFPDKMPPRLFELTMREHLNILETQVAAIGAAENATSRLDMLRQHYETRYRDIQTVLGRDWMWKPRDPATLPDAQTMGAQLFARYCSQCHAAPPPSLNTSAEWSYATRRMYGIVQNQSHAEVMGVRAPSLDEFKLIATYLETHGAQ